MAIKTEKYARKPLFVDAVRITEENFDEIVTWCQGETGAEAESGKTYIKVRVHNPKNVRQSRAFVGDWLLYVEGRGYKIYTHAAFHSSFELAPRASKKQLEKAFGPKKSGRNRRRGKEAPQEDQGQRERERLSRQLDAREKQAAGEVDTNGAGITQVTVEPAIRTETPQEITVAPELLEDEPPPIDAQVRHEIREAQFHHVSVHEKADPENGVHPIQSADAVQQEALATDDTKADFVDERVQVEEQLGEGIQGEPIVGLVDNVEAQPEQEKIAPAAAEGRRVLSIEEQRSMDASELKELIQSGEVVLAQDIASA